MTFENQAFKQKQLAESFSKGNFEATFEYLDETIEWHIVGDKTLKGRKSVIENCHQTAHYFKTITTHFTTLNVIQDTNSIAINGTAEFIRNGVRINYISACDVYTFNDQKMLQRIDSYCIES